jgi:hypothetical protein
MAKPSALTGDGEPSFKVKTQERTEQGQIVHPRCMVLTDMGVSHPSKKKLWRPVCSTFSSFNKQVYNRVGSFLIFFSLPKLGFSPLSDAAAFVGNSENLFHLRMGLQRKYHELITYIDTKAKCRHPKIDLLRNFSVGVHLSGPHPS